MNWICYVCILCQWCSPVSGLNRCRKSCRLRWLNYLKPSIKRGAFQEDEVDLMLRLHKLLGNRQVCPALSPHHVHAFPFIKMIIFCQIHNDEVERKNTKDNIITKNGMIEQVYNFQKKNSAFNGIFLECWVFLITFCWISKKGDIILLKIKNFQEEIWNTVYHSRAKDMPTVLNRSHE